MNICKNCGNKLDESDIYCDKCGNLAGEEGIKSTFSNDENSNERNSKIIMSVLGAVFAAWFIGIGSLYYIVQVAKLPSFVISSIDAENYPEIELTLKKLDKSLVISKDKIQVHEKEGQINEFSLDDSTGEIKLSYVTRDESLEAKKTKVILYEESTRKSVAGYYEKAAKKEGKLEVTNIDNSNYPEIKLYFKAADESGNAIEGLNENNILLSENDKSFRDFKVSYDGGSYCASYTSKTVNITDSKEVKGEIRVVSATDYAVGEYTYEVKSKADEYKNLMSNIENYSKTVLSKINGDYSLYFKDLASEESLVMNNRRNVSASTIKIFIMVEAYDQIKSGVISENDTVVLTNEMKAGGSGILAEKQAGQTYTVKEIIELMMTQSDNTAANILIDMLGMANINDEINKIGASDTKLNRKMMDQTAISRGIENYTSAKDLGLVLEKLYNGECIDSTYDDVMLNIMKNNKMKYKITNELPAGVESASKSGEYTGVENDSAIIYTDKGAYILCVTTSNGNSVQQVNAIKQISNKIYSEYVSYTEN